MNIDWSKAPEGATHWAKDSRCYNTEGIQFYKLRPGKRYQYFNTTGEWVNGGRDSDAPSVVFFPVSKPRSETAEERLHLILNACTCINKQVEQYNVNIECSAAMRAVIEAMIDAGYRKP